MEHQSIRDFLIASNNAGYAQGEEKKWTKEKDDSTSIFFEQDEWKSHDNFFGGEPYGGRTIVSCKGKPYWIMVYYGFIENGFEPTPIYEILRMALKNMPKDHPFRGPERLVEGEYTYTNNWNGGIERFYGEETIQWYGKIVYKANYMGGLVDVRKGV